MVKVLQYEHFKERSSQLSYKYTSTKEMERVAVRILALLFGLIFPDYYLIMFFQSFILIPKNLEFLMVIFNAELNRSKPFFSGHFYIPVV